MGSRGDIIAIRERAFPEPSGAPPNEEAMRRRKEANKRYRDSELGRKQRAKYRALEKVRTALLREFMRDNPELIRDYRKKYFTKRIDGLGGEK